MNKFTVYIIQSREHDLYYIGSTSNIEDRLKRHNTNRSAFTKGKGPWVIVAYKEFPSKAEAYRFELMLKSFKKSEFAISYIKKMV